MSLHRDVSRPSGSLFRDGLDPSLFWSETRVLPPPPSKPIQYPPFLGVLTLFEKLGPKCVCLAIHTFHFFARCVCPLRRPDGRCSTTQQNGRVGDGPVTRSSPTRSIYSLLTNPTPTPTTLHPHVPRTPPTAAPISQREPHSTHQLPKRKPPPKESPPQSGGSKIFHLLLCPHSLTEPAKTFLHPDRKVVSL